MKPWIALGLCLLSAAPAMAGTITGTVEAKGPVTTGPGEGEGVYASMRYKFAEKVDYDRLEDFVIYIDQAVPAAPDAGIHPATITQRNVSFEPHVLAIAVGTTVRWPNADDIFHNVFSMSETKEFNLGFYTKGDTPREIPFDKVGRVDVFCGIHSKMHCIILVLPNRYFTKVNARQHYFLPDLPAGTYKVTAWQERLPSQSREIAVPAQGDVRMDFVLGLTGLPKP